MSIVDDSEVISHWVFLKGSHLHISKKHVRRGGRIWSFIYPWDFFGNWQSVGRPNSPLWWGNQVWPQQVSWEARTIFHFRGRGVTGICTKMFLKSLKTCSEFHFVKNSSLSSFHFEQTTMQTGQSWNQNRCRDSKKFSCSVFSICILNQVTA